ncbi:MAG: hypothetical protein AB7P23_07820 [Amphiplicatus sp.]
MPAGFIGREIELITGLGSETLREWRRRELLDDIGRQPGGAAWSYSLSEAVRLAIAKLCVDAGLSVSQALKVGDWATGPVRECVLGKPRFWAGVIFADEPNGVRFAKNPTVLAETLNDRKTPPIGTILTVERLAEELPGQLRREILAESENV